MDYKLYDPTTDLDRLHEALKMPWIVDAYAEACVDYVQNSAAIEPRRAKWADKLLSLGRDLLPEDVNTNDNEWSEDIQPEFWHKFVTHSACHWMAWPYLLLAEELFPEGNWVIIETDAHTAVVNTDNNTIFDLTFAAYEVSPREIVEMLGIN